MQTVTRISATKGSERKMRFITYHPTKIGFPGGSVVKNLPASSGDRFDSWIGKIPWKRKWQPTPVFLPGEFHGQGNLVGYSPLGCKELDNTEVT